MAGAAPSLDSGRDLRTRRDFAPLRGLNEGIDFESNKKWTFEQHSLIQHLQEFKDIADIAGPAPDKLAEYVRSATPVHRISPIGMRMVVRDGGFRSRHSLEQLAKASADDAAFNRLCTHTEFSRIASDFEIPLRCTDDLLKASRALLNCDGRSAQPPTAPSEEAVGGLRDRLRSCVAAERLDEAERRLRGLVDKCATHTLEALAGSVPGIDHPTDKKVRTNRHVFSVIGPNNGAMYGSVVIIFKDSIMQHPDFNMTLCAATSYLTGRAYFHRPWVALGKLVDYEPVVGGVLYLDDDKVEKRTWLPPGDVGEVISVMRDGVKVELTEEQNIEFLHKGKLHPSVPDWNVQAAQDLALQCRMLTMSKRKVDPWVDGVTGQLREQLQARYFGGRPPQASEIKWEHVEDWYTSINPHGCIEGHLPDFVPLDYIEHIIVRQKDWPNLKASFEDCHLANGRRLDELVVQLPTAGYEESVKKFQKEHFRKRMQTSLVPVAGLQPNSYFAFGMESLQGKEVFLPLRLTDSLRGFIVRFRAEGQHIRLSFLERQEQSRGSDQDLYLVVIGYKQNSETYIKRKNKPGQGLLKSVTRSENVHAMASPAAPKSYWISFDATTGVFKVGHGDTADAVKQESQVFLQCTDPAPLTNIQFVAVSCWDTPVNVTMFHHADWPK